MRAGVPFVLRFTSKFFLEILPAALASVIGGFLFAQYHSSTTPAQPPVAEVTSSIPADRLAAMVEEEHTMLLDYLKRDRAGELPLSTPKASPAGPAKPRTAKESVVKVRRPPAAEERTASIGVPTPSPIRVAPPVSPTPTAAAPVAGEAPTTGALAVAAPATPARPDDPLVLADRDRAGLADIVPRPPEPAESRGVFGSVLSKAGAIKDKAINATGDAVTFVVRDIPSRVLPSRDKQPDDAAATDAPAADAPAATAPPPQPQRFSETTW